MPWPKKDLRADYYHHNFKRLTSFVREKYSDILHAEELLILDAFHQLSANAARLYVRLILRVGPLFRMDKLSYAEIQIESAVKELLREGFLSENPPAYYDEALDLWGKNEWLKWLSVKGLSSKSKLQIVEYVREQVPRELVEAELFKTCRVLLPHHTDWVLLLRLLFFGNLEQDLSQFILEDLGVMRFERYEICKEHRYFRSREHVDQSFELLEHQAELWEARELGEIDKVRYHLHCIDRMKVGDSLLLRKVDRLYNISARWLETQGELSLALKYYKKSKRPPARERRVRLLTREEEYLKALRLCQQMQKNPWDLSEREFLEQFPEKLKMKLGRDYKKQKRKNWREEKINIKRSKRRVELATLEYYESQGFKGFYLENSLWTGAFGLAFWEIIFSSRPGVFFHPFQQAPVDLMTPSFRQDCEAAIKARLNELQASQNWQSELLEMFSSKQGTANRLVNWKKLTKTTLKKVLSKVPKQACLAIFEHMSYDLRHRVSGFPDLFIYHPRRKDYCLVEVKGPGDQLQAGQKRWLKFFESQQIPYTIARISWS